MTKLRYLLSVATLFAAMLPGATQASIESVSFLNTDSFGLYVDTGGGVAGAPITSGVQLTVLGALFTSSASANVFSILGGPIATTAGGPTPAGLDSPIAQEGSAVANNSLFAPPFGVGVGPYGTDLAAPVPHALGDTAGSGSVIAGLGFPFGANLRKTAQADLAPGGAPGGFDIGTAAALDTTTGSFTVSVVGGPLSIVAIFDASRQMIADLIPAPPGFAAAASTSFSVSVTPAGALVPIFTWDPDGVLGTGITGGTEYSDPFTLNSSISTSPGSTATIANTTLAVGPPGPPSFRASVTLPPGIYSFNLTETVRADVSSLGGIPEPSTIAVWALLALCSGGAVRSRSLRRE